MLGAPVEQHQGEAEIAPHHLIAITGGGGGIGAQMDHRFKGFAGQPGGEFLGRDDIGDLALAQVLPFAALAQQVTDHHGAAAGLIECRHDIAANEAGAAGDEDHAGVMPASRRL